MTQQTNNKVSVSTDKCLQCGDGLQPGARFCGACGTRAGEVTPPPAEAPHDAGATELSRGPVSPLEQASQHAVATAPQALMGFTDGISDLVGGGIRDGLGIQPRSETAQRALTRLDRVAVMAKWIGAVRQFLVDLDPATFSKATREVLEMIAPFTTERDRFHDLIFGYIIALGQRQNHQAKMTAAFHAVLALLPERYKQAYENPGSASTLALNLGPGAPWMEILISWPYSVFQNSFDLPDDQLVEICIQTIYEGAFLLNLAPNGYLEEEEVRIENGLYPKTIKPLIRRAHAKCYGVDLKEWGDSADQRAECLTKQIAPFSQSTVYPQMQAIVSMAGMAMPTSFEKLSDWELQQIHAFAKDQTYNRQEVLSMLINRWESLTRKVSEMAGNYRMGFQAFQFILTMCLNMHSRRADPLHHEDYGTFLAQPGPLGIDMTSKMRTFLEEKIPHLTRCLFPEHESLFLLDYRDLRQRAERAADSVNSAKSSPAADAAEENKHSAEPSPPGHKIVWGRKVPLTNHAYGVRSDGILLLLDIILPLGENDFPAQIAALRDYVSANLAAYGLDKKCYKEMDDDKLIKYIGAIDGY